MKKNPTIKDCLELLESKGLIYKIHDLLMKYGFQTFMFNPIYPDSTNYIKKNNRRAIHDAYIEIHYLI